MVPAKYHHIIIPTYRGYICFRIFDGSAMTPYIAIGCKRIVRDQGYLQSLNRPNVRLTFDHIARVEPDGVITVTGIRPFLILRPEHNKSHR
jgi:cation diffusion facilitator CzcD-associated flavoprotein CzcO